LAFTSLRPSPIYAQVTLPDPLALPALHASHGGHWLRAADGRTNAVSKGDAIMAAADTPVLMLNAPLVASRLGYPDLSGLDLLEAFAFIHPARFCVPTPRGLAEALGLPVPENDAAVPEMLQLAAGALIAACRDPEWFEREGAWSAVQSLERLRWPWAQVLRPHIAKPERAERWLFAKLPEWEEAGERPAPRQVELAAPAVEAQLARLTGDGAEQREGQRAYARDAARIFAPRLREGRPHLGLAQAGTGDRQDAWAISRPPRSGRSRPMASVWISTFTKALQRQLGHEGERLFDDPAERKRRIVTRKGRENYLCLLNLEDALQGGFAGRAAILAQLVARWAAYTADGDMVGGDLPGWLPVLFRRNGSTALTDRRGECVYAGCPHYRKCFIERAARASADADIVIANHALVMVNAARGARSDHPPDPLRLRRGPPSVRRRRRDVRRRAVGAGDDRAAPLDHRS
jgi:ATP-dependent DNA helicase DinG